MKLLRIHCFQHVEYEDLGCIEEWCTTNGHPITYTRFYKGESLPKPEDYDWLIVMGGPMGVYEEDKYNWLSQEKEAIRAAIEQHKTVLGICLGSQLIAEVLGSRVYGNPEKEIGWFDIKMTAQGEHEPLLKGMQTEFKVFHWHGDTFDLPQGARLLFNSEACKNQAFLYSNHVLGIQFHFEVTERSIQAMIQKGKQELIQAKYVQSDSTILSSLRHIEPNNKIMFQILNNLHQ
jgi:GMP synthase-like glutamine amidotransferase